MANTNEQTLSTEAEDALLNDDPDPKEKTPTTGSHVQYASERQQNSRSDDRLDPQHEPVAQVAASQQHRRSTRL